MNIDKKQIVTGAGLLAAGLLLGWLLFSGTGSGSDGHSTHGNHDTTHGHHAGAGLSQDHSARAHDQSGHNHDHADHAHSGLGDGHSSHSHNGNGQGHGDGVASTRNASTRNASTRNASTRSASKQSTSGNSNEVWTCSMHPSVREDGPGSCPICGMDLIPAASEEREDDYTMVMTESAIRLANIQTTPVVYDVPVRQVDLPGRLRVDERTITHVSAYYPGRIVSTNVNFTGAPIRRGEPMATIYSPELLTAQRELLEADRQKERNPRMYEAARMKFELWGFSDRQVDAIIGRGEVQRELEILSPVDGVVLARNVTDQQYVSEGTVMFEVADLSRLWLVLEAYEEDMNWISVGDSIQFRLRGDAGGPRHDSSSGSNGPSGLSGSHGLQGTGAVVGGRHATVSFIDPVVHPQRRTAGVRAEIDNADGRLRPDMLATGTLRAEMREHRLMVPVTAVLWTGPRSLVYVRDPEADVPTFRVREVELGPRAGDFYVIHDGLEDGEDVVFNGVFRIDSEFQLADRFSMMNREPGSGAVPVHDHGGPGEGANGGPGEGANGGPGEGANGGPGEGANGDYNAQDRHDSPSTHDMDPDYEPFDDVPDDFRKKLTEAVQVYIRGKDAFVESDLGSAQDAFRSFREQLETIGVHGLSGSGHQAWMESYRTLHDKAGTILGAGDIGQARAAFRSLSDALVRAVKRFGIDGVVYRQYCPMVFDDEGGYWISDQDQIRNPYLPDTMLMCGEVIEKLEQD